MATSSLIDDWLEQLQSGDLAAAQPMWETYFERMVFLARQKLEGVPRSAADEEDVALSAFKSFCLGVREGRFSQLKDSHNLWPLLMAITLNKSVDLIRRQNRKKRGGSGGPLNESDAERVAFSGSLSDLISQEPSPEMVTEMSDELVRLLELLDATGDEALRQIALLKMDGYSNVEIADRLGCARRSVERKLQIISRIWTTGSVA